MYGVEVIRGNQKVAPNYLVFITYICSLRLLQVVDTVVCELLQFVLLAGIVASVVEHLYRVLDV